MFRGKKVIIFDMDGTLIDSVGIWNEVDRNLIKQLGHFGKNGSADQDAHLQMKEAEIQKLRDDTLREYRGVPNPYSEYCRALKERFGFDETLEEIIQARYDIAQRYLKHSIDYKPGADRFLRELKKAGFRLAIASTTKRDNMDVYRNDNKNIKSKAPIEDYFALVYTREDVKEIKPSPEVYLRVMEYLNVKGEECLVFEDSLAGIEAAHAAGIQTAVVYDRYSDGDREQINAMADYCIADYEQALALLEASISSFAD